MLAAKLRDPVRTIQSYRVYDLDMVCWGYQKSSDQLGCAANRKVVGPIYSFGIQVLDIGFKFEVCAV